MAESVRIERMAAQRSGALIDSRISRAMHVALGLAETDRVIFFRKEL
jgi:hypothetical protein